ncbi:hypothetical protein QKA_3088 [Clostridioides difficile DA00165]|nr:hypothetical protein QKA_3088 [Clostridioides difficile DA00165]
MGGKVFSFISIVAIISYTMPGTQSNTLYLAMNQAFGFS